MFQVYKILVISFLGLSLVMLSCKGGQSENTENTTPVVQKATFPTPPTDFLQDIYERVDYIDFVFDKTNFSISVSDPNDAKNNVTYLSQDPGDDVNCTPYMGRMYFSAEGVEIAVAQMHYSDDCKYFIFVDKSQRPKYACLMSQRALAFFENIFKQVQVK